MFTPVSFLHQDFYITIIHTLQIRRFFLSALKGLLYFFFIIYNSTLCYSSPFSVMYSSFPSYQPTRRSLLPLIFPLHVCYSKSPSYFSFIQRISRDNSPPSSPPLPPFLLLLLLLLLLQASSSLVMEVFVLRPRRIETVVQCDSSGEKRKLTSSLFLSIYIYFDLSIYMYRSICLYIYIYIYISIHIFLVPNISLLSSLLFFLSLFFFLLLFSLHYSSLPLSLYLSLSLSHSLSLTHGRKSKDSAP